jgi:Cu/Ag efflux protein CusF
MAKSKRLLVAVLISALIALFSISNNAFSEQKTERRPSKAKWEFVTIEATVESIDVKTREVKLKGPQGDLVTLEVDESVKRLAEVSVGDIVTADYYTFIAAEFRDPTPEEMKTPLVVLEEGGKAPEGMPPAALVGTLVQAVVTIESINREEGKVTIKGPRGKYLTLPVEDNALLEDLKTGEVVVMTYAEAVALSLEKKVKQ